MFDDVNMIRGSLLVVDRQRQGREGAGDRHPIQRRRWRRCVIKRKKALEGDGEPWLFTVT